MSVKVAFSTSCCCTSLQNINANLSLSLNVTAQSDTFWHGTQCEALVGMAVNVHHVRRWSTRVKWSHTTVVNQAFGSSHLLAGHDNWTRRCSSAQGPPDSTTLRCGGSDAQHPTVIEGRQDKRGRGERGVLCAATDDTSRDDAAKEAGAPLLRIDSWSLSWCTATRR